MLDALIFDIDGTLLDTNPAHVEAWAAAFERCGYRVAPDRIEVEIGTGADRLIPGILGRTAAARDGTTLRRLQTELFLDIIRSRPVRVFPRVPALFRALRERGLRPALATSSNRNHLDGLLERAGVDLCAMADVVVTQDDAGATKPAPDLIEAAVGELELSPAQCALVGDTAFDAEASRAGGVVCLGVLSGGKSADELLRAGARGVWRHTGELLDDLERALAIASPGSAHLTWALLEQLVRAALHEARRGIARGETPGGAVLVRGDGTIVSRAHDRLRATGDRTAHAEMLAFRAGVGRLAPGARDALLVSVLEPCVMCTGAAVELGVDAVVYALRVPAESGTERVRPPGPAGWMPRFVGGVLADEARGMLAPLVASA